MSVEDRMDGSVRGSCPMGCGATLFLGADGYVTCSFHRCPNPEAASLLLDAGTVFQPLMYAIDRSKFPRVPSRPAEHEQGHR